MTGKYPASVSKLAAANVSVPKLPKPKVNVSVPRLKDIQSLGKRRR